MSRLLAGLCVVTIALSACSSNAAPAPEAKLDPTEAATVAVIGGSLANEMSVALQAATAGTQIDVINETVRGMIFSESTQDAGVAYDWRTKWAEMFAEKNPSVVIVHVTSNPPEVICEGLPSVVVACERQARDLWMTVMYGDMSKFLSDRDVRQVWVMHPPVRAEANGVQAETNADTLEAVALIEALITTAPRTETVALWPTFAPEGTYTGWLEAPGGWHQARKPDGKHLCPWGAALAADVILGDLIEDWSPGGAWMEGPWWESKQMTFGTVDADGVLCDNELRATPPHD